MENVYLVSIVQWEDTYNIGIFSTLDKAKEAVKNMFGFPIRDDFTDVYVEYDYLKGIDLTLYGNWMWHEDKRVMQYYKQDKEGNFKSHIVPILSDKEYEVPDGCVYIRKFEINIMNEEGCL